MSYTLEFDSKKNRMYLVAKGMLSDQEVEDMCQRAVQGARAKLKPGFTLLSDLSNFRPLTQKSVQTMAAAVPQVAQLGMAASARVILQASLGVIQYQRATKDAPYPTYSVQSRQEGDTLLDEKHPWPSKT